MIRGIIELWFNDSMMGYVRGGYRIIRLNDFMIRGIIELWFNDSMMGYDKRRLQDYKIKRFHDSWHYWIMI